MDPHVPTRQTEPWTNEKHVKFINAMEASFVRTMLENHRRSLRLDRYLPDSSESTLDLESQRPKTHTISGPASMDSRTRGRRRASLLQCYDSSQDQVVPELENTTGADKAKGEPPAVAVASPAPPKY